MSLNNSIKRPHTFGDKSDFFGILFYIWLSQLA